MDIVCRISTSTARDMVRGIVEDLEEIPTITSAQRIAEEYKARGVYIRPEYLLDVWMEKWKEQ